MTARLWRGPARCSFLPERGIARPAAPARSALAHYARCLSRQPTGSGGSVPVAWTRGAPHSAALLSSLVEHVPHASGAAVERHGDFVHHATYVLDVDLSDGGQCWLALLAVRVAESHCLWIGGGELKDDCLDAVELLAVTRGKGVLQRGARMAPRYGEVVRLPRVDLVPFPLPAEYPQILEPGFDPVPIAVEDRHDQDLGGKVARSLGSLASRPDDMVG